MSISLSILFSLLAAWWAPPSGTCGAAIQITEVHVDPGRVPDRRGEFVELYNHGDQPANLRGWRLTDGARDAHVLQPDGPLVVCPGEFVVLAADSDPSRNGGVVADYQYRGITLANRADRLTLVDPCGTPTFDLAWPGTPHWPRIRKGRSIEQTRDPAKGPPSRWRRARKRIPSGDRATPGYAPWSRQPSRDRGVSQRNSSWPRCLATQRDQTNRASERRLM